MWHHRLGNFGPDVIEQLSKREGVTHCSVHEIKNSMSYVQRQTDKILRSCRGSLDLTWTILWFSSRRLRNTYSIFVKCSRYLPPWDCGWTPKKTCLGYPSVTTLLGTKMDAFRSTTTAERLKAIRDLKFLGTLAELEYYIGPTEWLRRYIAHYAHRITPL